MLDSGGLQAIIPPAAESYNCRGSVRSGAVFVCALISKLRTVLFIDAVQQYLSSLSSVCSWGVFLVHICQNLNQRLAVFQINPRQCRQVQNSADPSLKPPQNTWLTLFPSDKMPKQPLGPGATLSCVPAAILTFTAKKKEKKKAQTLSEHI